MLPDSPDRRQLLVRMSYDGGRFYGVELQPGRTTVASAFAARIEAAFGQPARALAFASRTDGGVHATGNLATAWVIHPRSADDMAERLAQIEAPRGDGLEAVLAVEVPREVYARTLAQRKHYRYTVATGYSAEEIAAIEARVSWRARQPEREGLAPPPADPVEARRWHIHPDRLDVEAMQRAASHLLGTHDFTSFCVPRSIPPDPHRTLLDIRVGESACNNCYTLDIVGESFLRGMARIVSGTLIEVGSGWRDPDSMPAILAARRRKAAGLTAPSRGLELVELVLGAGPAQDALRAREA